MIDTTGYKRITIEEINDDGIVNLLEAFVEKIAAEYMNALDDYRRHKTNKMSQRNYNKVRDYILSDDFNTLTNLDGHGVIRGLDNMYLSGYRMVI